MRRTLRFESVTIVGILALAACGGGDSPTGASQGAVFTLTLSAAAGPPSGTALARDGVARPDSGHGLTLTVELRETGGQAGGQVSDVVLTALLLDGRRTELTELAGQLLALDLFPEEARVDPGGVLRRDVYVEPEQLVGAGGPDLASVEQVEATVRLLLDGGQSEQVGASTRVPCFAADTNLCFFDGRFRTQVSWEDFGGGTGVGNGVQESDGSGYFWFFNPSRPEVLVEVLNNCPQNSRFWVFSSSVTPFNTVLTVTDTATGQSRQYTSDLGNPGEVFEDSEAFATCP